MNKADTWLSAFVVMLVVFVAGVLTGLPDEPPMFKYEPVVAVRGDFGMGSAFAVSIEGDKIFYLTANHVVDNISMRPMTINGYAITVEAVHPEYDLALISAPRVPSLNTEPLDFTSSVVGQAVFTNGFTMYGPDLIRVQTAGQISSTTNGKYLLYDGGVHPGLSGSPLFDEEGRVVGMLIAMMGSQYGANSAMAIYIPAGTLEEFVDAR